MTISEKMNFISLFGEIKLAPVESARSLLNAHRQNKSKASQKFWNNPDSRVWLFTPDTENDHIDKIQALRPFSSFVTFMYASIKVTVDVE